MGIEVIPEWMTNLENEDLVFIKKVYISLPVFKRSSQSI